MTTDRTRIGLIVPASNTVMEPDFHRKTGELFITSTWRILLESVTREAEFRMLQELPKCLDNICSTRPDIIVFGCTSAGSLDGLQHDAAIADSIKAQTGSKAVTVMTSVTEQLQTISPRTVAVLTPYPEELTRSVAGCITEAGYEVVLAEGMGLLDNLAIGRMEPGEIVQFATKHMPGVNADCLFLSCTNWQAIPVIDPLRDLLGIPVVSSNQAAIESVCRLTQETPV